MLADTSKSKYEGLKVPMPLHVWSLNAHGATKCSTPDLALQAMHARQNSWDQDEVQRQVQMKHNQNAFQNSCCGTKIAEHVSTIVQSSIINHQKPVPHDRDIAMASKRCPVARHTFLFTAIICRDMLQLIPHLHLFRAACEVDVVPAQSSLQGTELQQQQWILHKTAHPPKAPTNIIFKRMAVSNCRNAS